MIDHDYFSNRVSVRSYRDEQIPDELLESIIAAVMRAPTCGNMQLYSVIISRDKAKKENLAKLREFRSSK